MTKHWIKQAGCISLMTAVMLLTACTGKSEDEIENSIRVSEQAVTEEASDKTAEKIQLTMSFFGETMDKDGYEFFVEGLDEVYPEIELAFVYYTKDEDYYNYLRSAASSNTLPDIIMMTDENVEEYITNGILEPLDGIIEEAGADLTRFNPMLLEGWKDEGCLYGLPKDLGTSMMAYNQEMLEDHGIDTLPATMDELRDLAERMTTEEMPGICMNIHEFHITQYIHAFGGGWNNGQTINSQENVTGITYMVDMFRDGYACTPNQLALDWDGPVLGSVMAGMSTGGSWYPGFVSESAPDIGLVYGPIPRGTASVQTVHSGGYTVAATSEHKSEAMKVIDYMTRDEAMAYTVGVMRRIPSTQDGIDAYIKTVEDEGYRTVLGNIRENGRSFDYPPHKSAFTEDLLNGMESIIFLEEMTVEDLLDDLQEKYGTE